MDVTVMLDTKANSRCCACWMTNTGGLPWLLRCRGQLEAVSNTSNMKVFMPKPQCNQSLLPLLWSCCILTLPALRWQWSRINPKLVNCLVFVTILQNTLCCMWPPIILWKLLLSFCHKVTSQSLEHQPNSWGTKGPTLKATSSESFVSLWAYWS